MGNYLFQAQSTSVQGDEETGISPGDPIEIPVIVHELYSQPYNIQAVPSIYKEKEIEEAVENIEEKLGYELEKPDNWEEIKKSPEKCKEIAETSKQAGFINGELHAR